MADRGAAEITIKSAVSVSEVERLSLGPDVGRGVILQIPLQY